MKLGQIPKNQNHTNNLEETHAAESPVGISFSSLNNGRGTGRLIFVFKLILIIECMILPENLKAQESYFPLSVGSQWQYESTDENYPAVELKLAISDTFRISETDPLRGEWIETLPHNPLEGKLYYRLEGEELLRKVGIRPSLHRRVDFRAQYDAILIREEENNEGYKKWMDDPRGPPMIWADTPLQNFIMAGGVRNSTDGKWLIFETDLPLWRFPWEEGKRPSFYIYGVDGGGGLQIWHEFNPRRLDDKVLEDIDSFCAVITSGDRYMGEGFFRDAIPPHRTTVCFRQGVGIFKILQWGGLETDLGFDLVNFFPGNAHQTATKPISWGVLKRRSD